MQLKPTSAPHAGTQKIVPRGPNFCQESPPPIFFRNELWRCVRIILPGIPPYGSGGGHGSSSLRHNGRTKQLPLLPTVTIRLGSYPHAGWRGWLERGLRMLLECGTIVYWTLDSRGLFSISQIPWTSALSKVTIRPSSAPPKVERVHE